MPVLTPVLVPLAAVLGLAVGSFLNVVVWRVPRGESVAHPPSACPGCGSPIRARDNVPLLSWVLLRGRCRDCGAPISVRYPLVEAATAVLFGATTWWVGASWVLPALLYLVAIGVALTLIDLDTYRLPNAIVLPSYPVSLVLLALAGLNPGGAPAWDAFGGALLGGAALLGIYLLVWRLYPAGTGLGDVKLAGVLGLHLGWFGWDAVVVGWFAAYVVGGVVALVLLLAGRARRKTPIPFGPFMIVGCAVGLVASQPVADWYLGFL